MKPLLEGVRVLEVDAGLGGAYCGRLLASLGADVVVVEPQGGGSLRSLPPLVCTSLPADEWSLSYAYLSAGKESVAPDEHLGELVAKAEILLTRRSSAWAPPRAESLASNPALVYVDITPYGGDAEDLPKWDVDLLVMALGGWLYGVGDPQREPLKPPNWQSAVLGGTVAASAAIGGFLGARKSGVGEYVDVSQQASVAWFLMNPTTVYSYSGAVWRRDGGISPSNYPQGLMWCKDGPISVNVMYYAEWDRFCDLMGRPDWREDARLATPLLRLANRNLIDSELLPWLQKRSVREAVAEAQAHKLPFAPIHDPATLMADEHLAARDYWDTLEHPHLGAVRAPGTPFRVDRERPRPQKLSFRSGRGGPIGVLSRWVKSGTAGDRTESSRAPVGEGCVADRICRPSLPLAGVRVVDLTMAWAGPMTTRVLAELGAQVIKVETSTRMDRWRGGTSPQRGLDRYPNGIPGERPWNRNAFFNTQNTNKLGISVNLKTQPGKEILLDLVRGASILVENFSSGAMGRLGLDYERLRQVQPQLVMVSMPAFGRSGPNSGFVAHGPTIEAAGGNVALQGYEGELPLASGAFAWGDPVAGVTGALAALAGLAGLALHGQGCHIDLSHQEAAIPFNFPSFLEYSALGTWRGPSGNRDPLVPFQAVLPCTGDDRWVAVAAVSGSGVEQLHRFVVNEVVEVESNEALLTALASWSANRHRQEVIHRLSSLPDVACVPVLDASDLHTEEHLTERGFYRRITHPEAGTHQYPGMPWNFKYRPWAEPRPAPCFGADTVYVLVELLGRTQEEVERLLQEEVISLEPALQGD